MQVLSISENILKFISGVGVLQGVLLSVLIYFHPRSDRSVNKFLALYLLCLTIIMLGPLTFKVIGWKNSFFMSAFPVLAGPLLYFYVRSFKEEITWRKAAPHLLLFFVFLGGAYLFVQHLAAKFPAAVDFPPEGFRSPVAYLFFVVRYTQLFLYYFLSRRELRSYQKSIRHLFSETSAINLHWVKWLISGFIIIIIASVFIYFLMAKYISHFYTLYLLNIAIATPYIYLATYKGILQPTVWQKVPAGKKGSLEEQLHASEEMEKTGVKQQSQKFNLGESRIGEILEKLTGLLEREKLYQEPELTLQQLADRLSCPSHQVSFAINEGMKKTFYDLVNGYRVAEAKRLLLDPGSTGYTILSIGFDAGFNSKTTFNTVFKKFTGMTPTEFRNRAGADYATA